MAFNLVFIMKLLLVATFVMMMILMCASVRSCAGFVVSSNLIPTTATCHYHHLRLRSTRNAVSDWDQYVKDPMRAKFEKSGGILYKKSIFTESELERIRADIQPLKLQDENSAASVAKNRRGAQLQIDTDTVRLFRDGSLSEIVKTIMGQDYELSDKVPVEVCLML